MEAARPATLAGHHDALRGKVGARVVGAAGCEVRDGGPGNAPFQERAECGHLGDLAEFAVPDDDLGDLGCGDDGVVGCVAREESSGGDPEAGCDPVGASSPETGDDSRIRGSEDDDGSGHRGKGVVSGLRDNEVGRAGDLEDESRERDSPGSLGDGLEVGCGLAASLCPSWP